MKKILIIFLILLCGCTVYTEKRSESLSQAVFATADSIKNARFDKAGDYADQAKKLAYPPKEPIKIDPIITKNVKKIESINGTSIVKKNNIPTKTSIKSNIITSTSVDDEEETVLRLVVPEYLKHAKLLIENSEEWNELLKIKQFKDQLEQDNMNLKELASNVDRELQKQLQYNNKIIQDLNNLQKQVVEKNLHILRLYIVIFGLVISIAAGIYLRIKGIL
jgi:hypothetical protein